MAKRIKNWVREAWRGKRNRSCNPAEDDTVTAEGTATVAESEALTQKEYRPMVDQTHIERLLNEVREARTVQDGLIAVVNDLRSTLESIKADAERIGGEEVATEERDYSDIVSGIEEAIAVLDAMQRDGAAALKENVDPEEEFEHDENGNGGDEGGEEFPTEDPDDEFKPSQN